MAELDTVSGYAFSRQPVSNISPFTYRDGATYLNLLYGIIKYINDEHIPEINALIDEVEQIINDGADSMNQQLAAAIDQFTTMIADTNTQNQQLVTTTLAQVVVDIAETNAANVQLVADTTELFELIVESINNKSGPIDIQRVTLSSTPYVVDIDPVWPTNQPVTFALKQDATGGRTAVLAENITGELGIDPTPTAQTTFTLVPNGDDTWHIIKPLDKTIAAYKYPEKDDALSFSERAAKDMLDDAKNTFAPLGAVKQRYKQGKWYWLADISSIAQGTVGNNRMTFAPFLVSGPERLEISDMFTEVAVAGSAEAKFYFAIYNDDGYGAPAKRVAVSALVDANTIGIKSAAVATLLDPGLYWYAIYTVTAATQPKFVLNGASVIQQPGSSLIPTAGATGAAGYALTDAAGVTPATVVTHPDVSWTMPRTGIRVSLLNFPRTLVFDGDFDNLGLTAYDSIVHQERVTLIPDPLGNDRTVVKLTSPDTDTGPTAAPRVQFEPYQALRKGTRFWFGFSLMLPEDWPVLPADGWVNFAEIYGAPYGGASPTKIYINGDADRIAWHRGADYNNDEPWSMPVIRGKWMDFAIQARLSEDETVGFFEIWLNTGNGWQQQLLNGVPRLYTKTQDATNNMGNNNAQIKLYRKPGMFAEMTCYFATHKVGHDFESVDPHTYG